MYNNVQNNKSAKLAKLNTHYEYLLMSGVDITRPFLYILINLRSEP